LERAVVLALQVRFPGGAHVLQTGADGGVADAGGPHDLALPARRVRIQGPYFAGLPSRQQQLAAIGARVTITVDRGSPCGSTTRRVAVWPNRGSVSRVSRIRLKRRSFPGLSGGRSWLTGTRRALARWHQLYGKSRQSIGNRASEGREPAVWHETRAGDRVDRW
jgi:hypothetical protein